MYKIKSKYLYEFILIYKFLTSFSPIVLSKYPPFNTTLAWLNSVNPKTRNPGFVVSLTNSPKKKTTTFTLRSRPAISSNSFHYKVKYIHIEITNFLYHHTYAPLLINVVKMNLKYLPNVPFCQHFGSVLSYTFNFQCQRVVFSGNVLI